MTTPIGILHPGEMGVSIAASAKNGGHSVYWASEGRGSKTREHAGASVFGTGHVGGPVSHVPGHRQRVPAPHGRGGGRAGAGAGLHRPLPGRQHDLAPARGRIGERMAAAGASFVDGGIVGGPAWQPDSTWLYLSGQHAAEAAALFAAVPLETVVIGDEIGKASALKMCVRGVLQGQHRAALRCGRRRRTTRRTRRSEPPVGARRSAVSRIRTPAACAGSRPRRGASPARWTRSRRPSTRPACRASFTRPPPLSIAAWRDSRTRLQRHRWKRP